ncbi:MAG: hypothetical protein IJX51_05060 [Clostridia bacterium]|nr:hypothetical protein [Clostridia bacterium]
MAYWIWLDPQKYPHLCDNSRSDIFGLNREGFCMAEFVREYSLNGDVTLKICADARYELFINGEFLGRGPASAGADFLTKKMNYCYYDEYEIKDTPLIKIRVVVTSQATAINEFTFGHPGVFAELTDKNGSVQGTDESWLCRPLTERRHAMYTDYTEKEDVYSAPCKIPDIHNVKKSPLMHLCEDTVYPTNFDKITVKCNEKTETVLFFDKIYSAFPEISVKCDGKILVYFETSEIEGVGRVGEEFIVSRDIVHRCQRMRSVGYMRISVENMSDKDAYIDGVVLRYSHYPVRNEAGFSCSDPVINKVYDVCMHTLKICRQNTHLDSPTHQEPIACTGDYFIQALMEYYNIYDPTLTAFDIYRTSQILEIQKGRMFHTSYSLMFPMWLYDYYMHTGDTSLVYESKKAMECLFSLFDTYVAEDNGLLEYAPDYMFVDWIAMKDAEDPYADSRDVMSHGKGEGYSLHHPPKSLGQSVLCILYYRSLLCASHLYRVIGEEKSAMECCKKAEEIKESINTYLYDKEKEMYIGGLNTPDRVENGPWLPQNTSRVFYLKQANTLAVLYGVAPEEKRVKILERVVENLRKEEMQPYFYHFLFEAIYKEGLFHKYGLELIRQYKSLMDKCDKGLCEAWEFVNGDCSHAWGGSPAYILKKALSGFEMVEPGYKKIKLNPQLYSLDYASLGISTPYGPISIELKGQERKISVPDGIEVI